MKKTILQIIAVLTLTSCSNHDQGQNRLKGLWKIDHLRIEIMHAIFQTPKNDSIEIEPDFINPNFQLELNKDSTFSIRNQDGSTDKGTYTQTSDSLILNKDDKNWLKFKIEESNNEFLKLKADRIRFYDVENDSIHFVTGNVVTIKMKKTAENNK